MASASALLSDSTAYLNDLALSLT
ncbi:hypothetical protein VTL71DRAFT_5640 [Oculimacula yallundae]|uniref:Uncharacterized protein n=1 Tax=Oculimacula yallundae TaxID=86028 RepID=A0ABR4BY43_9HELO